MAVRRDGCSVQLLDVPGELVAAIIAWREQVSEQLPVELNCLCSHNLRTYNHRHMRTCPWQNRFPPELHTGPPPPAPSTRTDKPAWRVHPPPAPSAGADGRPDRRPPTTVPCLLFHETSGLTRAPCFFSNCPASTGSGAVGHLSRSASHMCAQPHTHARTHAYILHMRMCTHAHCMAMDE